MTDFDHPNYRASNRYQQDPAFRSLVDMLEHQLHLAYYTPSELREAALLAMTHFESYRLRQLDIRDGQIVDRLHEIHREIDKLREEAIEVFAPPLFETGK